MANFSIFRNGELDVLALFVRLWQKRYSVIIIALVGMLVGFFALKFRESRNDLQGASSWSLLVPVSSQEIQVTKFDRVDFVFNNDGSQGDHKLEYPIGTTEWSGSEFIIRGSANKPIDEKNLSLQILRMADKQTELLEKEYLDERAQAFMYAGRVNNIKLGIINKLASDKSMSNISLQFVLDSALKAPMDQDFLMLLGNVNVVEAEKIKILQDFDEVSLLNIQAMRQAQLSFSKFKVWSEIRTAIQKNLVKIEISADSNGSGPLKAVVFTIFGLIGALTLYTVFIVIQESYYINQNRIAIMLNPNESE